MACAPFVSGTLDILLTVYLTDSQEREGGSLSNANTSGNFSAVCQMIDSFQESPRTRSHLVDEFSLVCIEAINVGRMSRVS